MAEAAPQPRGEEAGWVSSLEQKDVGEEEVDAEPWGGRPHCLLLSPMPQSLLPRRAGDYGMAAAEDKALG